MNRLSVRLSIVGAVLTLGAAAIAQQLLSNSDSQVPEADGSAKQVAEAIAPAPAVPIRTDEVHDDPPVRSLAPPPASAFNGLRSLRTVSHEDASDDLSTDTPPADPVATLGADIPPDVARSAYEPVEPLASDDSDGPDSDSGQPGEPAGTTPLMPLGNFEPAAAEPVDASPAAESPRYDTVATDSSGSFPLARPGQSPASAASSPSQPPPAAFPLGSSVPAAAGKSAAAATRDDQTTTRDTAATMRDNPAETRDNPATTRDTAAAAPGNAAGFTDSRSYDRVPGDEPSGASLSPGPDMTRTTVPASPSPGLAFGAGAAGLTSRDPYPTTDAPAHPIAPSTAATDVGSPLPAASGSLAGSALLSSNVPGDRALEGEQSPAIVLEKSAPDEIQVDKKATFQLRVRNVGNTAAHNVVVIDSVPRGTDFVDAVPECTAGPDGMLIWNLKTMQAGEEVILAVNVLPKVAGEIGSVAQVTFQAQAAVRTICTKPQLSLALTIPEQVLIGEPATVDITVTNSGSGAATNVVIEEDVPDGFTHAAGRQLEHEVGTLLPQESRRLSLVLEAAKAGVYENRLTVRGDGNLLEEDVRKIEVATPKLEVTMQGPVLRYLDRQATYVVRMANPGTASARNVELVTFLPKGMKYVTSDNHGQYDSQTHAVYWSLEELPAAKQGDVHLTVLPVEPGNHKLKADGHADLGLQHTCEHEVVVESLAELLFTVADVADPIEVGSETSYEVRVHNRGSKADSDIRVIAELPAGMVPVSGDGPVPATVQGSRVIFSPLARLAPDEEAIFKVHATGEATGDHVIRVQLQSAEVRVPVTKEEITRVYTDQ